MNRCNADLNGSYHHTNLVLHKKYQAVRSLFSAVSGIALLVASIGLSQPAMAASSGGAISNDTAGFTKGGSGGGAVDLTTL